MEDEGQKPNGEDQDGKADDDLQQTFDRDYVVTLRGESAKYRKQAKEYKDKAAEYEKQIKDAETKRLEEQQQWRELAETRQQELEDVSKYRDMYEAMLDGVDNSNKRRIESIPQDMRTLVPELDPVALAQWLDANEVLLKKPTAPNLSAAAGNNDRPGTQVILSDEELDIARKLGVSAEEYKKRKA